MGGDQAGERLQVTGRACVLSAWVSRVDPGTLRVGYELANLGPRTCYVFNLLHSEYDPARGGFVLDPDLAWVAVEAGSVVVQKRVLPLPPHASAEHAYIPCVSRVPPGQALTETFTLRLPLRPAGPYEVPEDRELRPDPATLPVVFELGCFHAHPRGEDLAEEVATSRGPAVRFYPFTVTSQQVLRAGPFALEVPVLLPR